METSHSSMACVTCPLANLCRTAEGAPPARRRVPKGEALYRAGDSFENLYAVHAGFFKLRTTTWPAEHVSDFQMTGEVLGLDGLGSGRHSHTAIALEDSAVCVVPYGSVQEKIHVDDELQQAFHGMLGRELDRQRQTGTMLATYNADARIATFLLDLARRLGALGYSASQLHLRMTRQDIGSYLGLTLETVSRCLSKFKAVGVLRVSVRSVQILDAPALAQFTTARPA